MKQRNYPYFLAGFLLGALALALFSAMQKAKLGVPVTQPLGYAVPILFGGASGLAVALLLLRQRRLFREKLEIQQQAQEELEGVNVQLLQEIGERREAQAALESNEQWLRSLINAIPDFIIFLDNDGRRVVANNVARDMFSLTDTLFSSGDDRPQCPMRETILAAFDIEEQDFWEQGEAVSARLDLQTGRGERIYEVTRVPLFFEDASRKGCVLLGRDITRQVRVQEELTRYAHFNKLLLDSVGEGIYGVDVAGSTTFLNPAAQLLTGFSEEDLLGENQHTLLHHSREDGSAYPESDCPINHTLTTGHMSRVEDDVFWRKDGTCFHVDFTCTPIVERGTIVGAVVVFRDITLRREAERKLAHQAYHDELTGLPNRAMFMRRLEQAMARVDEGNRYAMLFFDLDNFKLINDSFGHHAGDELLALLARRVENAVQDRGLLARLGGDEFAVLVERVDASMDAMSLAQDIHKAIASAFRLEHHLLDVSASMGVVFSSAEHAHPHQVLRDADIAMYQAKARGKGYTEVFNREMHEQIMQRMQLERELTTALLEEQFRVYYQPVMDLKKGGIAGFEALVRWQHPERGLLAPGAFIGLAEETGLIVPLGEWVLRTACAQLASWRNAYPHAQDMTMSVNVSPRQITAIDLTALVRHVLQETGLPPSSLKIELTEGMLVEDVDLAAEVLSALELLGVGAVLDDFGTGYSSLSHLRLFPLTMVKVDRSFVGRMVESLDDAAIVANLIELAHILDLRVTAEGVENKQTLKQLLACNCDLAQGYCISRPQPAEKIERLLVENNPRCDDLQASV